MPNLPRKIRVGFLGENDTDFAVMEILMSRVLDPRLLPVIQFVGQKTRTSILGYVRAYLHIFFENPIETENMALAIFVTDQDWDARSRRDTIIETIESYNPTYIDKCAVGVPNPHIEAWLIADRDNTKRIFNFPSGRAFPRKISPKDFILGLISHQTGVDTMSREDAYKKLANTSSIKIMRSHCKDFNQFCEDLTSKSKIL